MFNFRLLRQNWLLLGCLALILTLPLLFLLTGREWLYTPIIYTDSYIDHTFSFFYDFPFRLPYYKAARVPWVAPLFYLQMLVGPHLLAPVLLVSSWLVISLLYFFVVRELFGLNRGVLLLPWIVFFPHLTGLAAGGVMYNNTAAVCYILLALLLWIRRHSHPHPRALMLASGFLAGCALATNVVYIHLLPLFAVADYYKQQPFRFRHYLWAFAGFAGSFLFWGAINHLHHRPFWFFLYTLKTSEHLILHPENQSIWWTPLSRVFFLSRVESFHMIFFISTFTAAVIRLARTLRAGAGALRGEVFSLVFALLWPLWIFWHYTGQTSLTPADFSYPLQLPMFLMLAAWVNDEPLTRRTLAWIAGTAVFLWLCQYASFFVQLNILFSGGWSMLILAGIATVLMLSIFVWPARSYRSRAGYLVLMGFLFSVTSYEPRGMYQAGCTYRSDSYRAIIDIVSNLQHLQNRPGRFLIHGQFGEQVPIDKCYYNRVLAQDEYPKLASLMLGHYISNNNLDKKVSEFTAADFEVLKRVPDMRLVLFPFRNPEYSPEFLKVMSGFGYEFQKEAEFAEVVMGHRIPYEVYVLKPAG